MSWIGPEEWTVLDKGNQQTLFKEKLVLASGSISADRDSFCSSCFLTPRSCPSGKNRYPVTDQGRHIKPWFGPNMWWLMAHFNSRVLLQGQLWLSDQLDLAAQVLALLSSVPYLQGGSQGHSLTNTLHTTLLSHFLEPQQGVKNHIMTLEDLINKSFQTQKIYHGTPRHIYLCQNIISPCCKNVEIMWHEHVNIVRRMTTLG